MTSHNLDNIEILKQFLIRNKNQWNIAKPVLLINLLDELKIRLRKINESNNSIKISKQGFISQGEDKYQQNALELAKEYSKDRIIENNISIKKLEFEISMLRKKLGLNTEFSIPYDTLPINIEPIAENLFKLVRESSTNFQSRIFHQLKNLILGDLIDSKKRYIKENSRIDFYSRQLEDYEIGVGIREKRNPDTNYKELMEDVKNSFIEFGNYHKVKHLIEVEPESINSLLKFYQIDDKSSSGVKQLGELIRNRLDEENKSIQVITEEIDLYINLLNDFNTHKDKWISNWINEEIDRKLF